MKDVKAIDPARRAWCRAAGAALLAAGGLAAAPARAQGGTIRLVVPYGPGGAGDVIARIVAQRLGAETGANVVVENRPGGGGMIGAQAVASAAGDGNTILLGNTTEICVSPVLVKSAPYDSQRDFKPVALAGHLPQLLVAHPGVKARTVPELIAYAKAHPNQLSYATAGAGSAAHITGALLEKLGGVKMLRVPYKGGAQAVADVLAGNVSMYFSGIPPAIAHVRTGKLVALGVAQRKPVSSLPNVPPLAHGALARLDLSAWFGFFVPKDTPDDTVATLNAQVRKILDAPEVQARLVDLGVEPESMTASQFAGFVATERKKYADLISELAIQSD
jgi:tripartite-type tricarboxylate transporter receptor subunit TctC